MTETEMESLALTVEQLRAEVATLKRLFHRGLCQLAKAVEPSEVENPFQKAGAAPTGDRCAGQSRRSREPQPS